MDKKNYLSVGYIFEKKVENKNIRFFKITQIAYIIGASGHLMGGLSFNRSGFSELALFNFFFSVPAFTIAFFINRKGMHNLAFTLAFIELLSHQIIAVFFLGWDSGAQYWLIYLIGLIFFNANWSNKLRIFCFVIVFTTFGLLYIFCKNPYIYDLQQSQYDEMYLGSSLFVLILLALLINYYVQDAHKAEKKLKMTNIELFEKKEKILQSIVYAEKIQKAVLPTEDILKMRFKDYFILFLPRDIVSGDFYWFYQEGSKTVTICADCTGHGVPGGLMSMLGVSFLNELVKNQKILRPEEILEEMRKKVKTALNQTGKIGEQKDGMDMSVCVFDDALKKMDFAGANNGVFLIRDNELIEFKPTRNPIGIKRKEVPFSQKSISLNKDDQIFFYTDGYVDQFGGDQGKSFKKSRLKKILIDYKNLPMDRQKFLLESQILKWMSGFEQIDDITLIGLNI